MSAADRLELSPMNRPSGRAPSAGMTVAVALWRPVRAPRAAFDARHAGSAGSANLGIVALKHRVAALCRRWRSTGPAALAGRRASAC